MLDEEHDCIPAGWEEAECHPHPIHIAKGELASGDSFGAAHEISFGQAVIPAQVYTTWCECFNNTCSHAEQENEEHIHEHSDYNVNGYFNNEKYTARQECQCANDTFDIDGERACDFDLHDHSANFECCDCRHNFGRASGNLDERCECDDSCLHANHVLDPDADIDRRIEESVEKAISDVLSNMVHRCITDSLKNCI